jgi:hypothetical protein
MRSILIILIIFFLSGCFRPMYVSSVKTNDNYRPGTVSKSVKIYLTGEVPEYEEVGLIQVVLSGYQYDLIDKIVETARMKATEMGADCIILFNNNILTDKKTSILLTDDDVPVTVESLGRYPKYVFIAGRLKG